MTTCLIIALFVLLALHQFILGQLVKNARLLRERIEALERKPGGEHAK